MKCKYCGATQNKTIQQIIEITQLIIAIMIGAALLICLGLGITELPNFIKSL